MKKLLVLAICLVASINAEAQIVKFGIKGGANFAKLYGSGDLKYEMVASFHAGVALEIKALPTFAIQPEVLYSSQGAKVEGSNDIKLDYVSVPVMFKFYVIPRILSLDVGPQFSFLVSDNLDNTIFSTNDDERKSFDFAAAGGLGVNITKKFTFQARYVAGLTETMEGSGSKNNIFQASVIYYF